MKKLMFLAICLMAMMMGCKQKGQKSPENSKDSVTAVIDSIIEENDTTPLPMFLVGNDGKFMQMLYWTNFEEPKKSGDDDEFFETYHKRWELQEMFRRNAAQYTNLLCGDKIIKVKFVDEVLKDPDGNTPSVGEIHSREGIPSLCARYDYANPKEKPHKQSLIDSWGLVVCTDSYLASRKRLDIQHLQADDYSYPTKLPADIVQKLEAQYGMKAESAVKTCVIDGRYTMGAVQFKGEYKNAPKDKYDPDRKFALALEVLIDSGKVYILEQLGYFDPQYGSSWNADADGYFPNDITAAFEGPKGLELCYTHSAPESFCIGMLFPREGKLVEMEYECYHSLVDDKNGAFFIRKDGKFQLMAVENPRFRPLKCYKDGISYLKLAGPAGGPSWQREIHAFKNGKRIWKLNVLEVEGKIDECSLNDKDISNEEGKAYLDMVPEGEEITAFFKEINPK